MNTQITIETTPDQEMVIGLLKTGHLVKANKADVREFYAGAIEGATKQLDNKAKGILEAAGARVTTG